MRPAVNHALGGLCENCVTECCTVVMGTAFAMGVPPVHINNFGYLQMKWRTPKAGVLFVIKRRHLVRSNDGCTGLELCHIPLGATPYAVTETRT